MRNLSQPYLNCVNDLICNFIIAAPENISPEKGTTYKLVRKVFNGSEHVHVVGLKGFGQQK